jgi:hypothetical protein
MNVLLYPLHLCRQFGRHWSTKVVQDNGKQSPSQATDGCTVCGRIALAPMHATYLPAGKLVNQWRCSACRHSWQTSADFVSSVDIGLGRSGDLRENAGHCLTQEDTAVSEAAREQYRRMGDAWFALAETQDWLDGVTSPVRQPLPQNAQACSASTAPNAMQGHLS